MSALKTRSHLSGGKVTFHTDRNADWYFFYNGLRRTGQKTQQAHFMFLLFSFSQKNPKDSSNNFMRLCLGAKCEHFPLLQSQGHI